MTTEFFTKWPEADALPNCKAELVVSFLVNEITSKHGCLLKIIAKQDTYFKNQVIVNFCQHVEIRYTISTSYYSQTNSQMKRFNYTLYKALARKAQLSVKLNMQTYLAELFSKEKEPTIIINQIVVLIDYLKEVQITALENIK
ncbi:842_t:CDS:2 [Cetraspora pellucida]|uniref:842_t:CDS:1 n=1 Tax=Cetraspora pellucida TaxID=1433469 RepID=A0ACA9M240_9GLOM|nr:842_t:CDS:2 [Cetraspora pellucida]